MTYDIDTGEDNWKGKVYIDGQYVPYCWRANEEEGWIDVPYLVKAESDFKDGLVIVMKKPQKYDKVKHFRYARKGDEVSLARAYGEVKIEKE